MEERGSYELLWVPKFLELFGQNFRLPPNIVEIYGATLVNSPTNTTTECNFAYSIICEVLN